MLKFIQKWLHNIFLEKYGFGWLYSDFFYISEYFWQMTLKKSTTTAKFFTEVRAYAAIASYNSLDMNHVQEKLYKVHD
jgi:hypothetical protein